MPDVPEPTEPTEPTKGQRRQRRRRRAVWRPGEGISRSVESDPAPERVAPVPTEPVAKPAAAPAKRTPWRASRNDPAERGLREIVGAGPSQLDPVRAMRARDANRPTDADLAQAEQELAIVHRNWKPPKTP